MSMNLNPVRELVAIDHFVPRSGGVWVSEPSTQQAGVTYASLIDLARMQFGASSVEICDACNTLNVGSAHHCKGCAHKLPAYYAASEAEARHAGLDETAQPLRRTWTLVNRASFTDFAAFALVVNLMVMVAEMLPLQ